MRIRTSIFAQAHSTHSRSPVYHRGRRGTARISTSRWRSRGRLPRMTRREAITLLCRRMAGLLQGSTPTPRALVCGAPDLPEPQFRDECVVWHFAPSGGHAVVSPGGAMTLMVGNTYYIQLVGFTATQGYEQLESFLNFPNTIFQILSVSTDYSADTSGTVSDPNDKAYGDACTWENDPNSLNYRSCLSTGKVGGDIIVTYQVKILQMPTAPLVNPEPLNSLIYDFSGSSYHYNADFSASVRYANIVSASLAKSFAPKTITPGGTSTLTFTISNPGPAELTDANFTDNPFPSGLALSSSPTVSYSGCGTPSPAAGALTPGGTSLSFTGITVAPYGTCRITVDSVTATTPQNYANTTQHLYINTSVDTGSFGSDTLVVSTKPPAPSTCTTRVALATWNFASDITTVALGPNVASASALSAGGSFAFDGTEGNAAGSFSGTGWPVTEPVLTATTQPYFQFSVDASNYGGLGIAADYAMLQTMIGVEPIDTLCFFPPMVPPIRQMPVIRMWQPRAAGRTALPESATLTDSATGTFMSNFRINGYGRKPTIQMRNSTWTMLSSLVVPGPRMIPRSQRAS